MVLQGIKIAESGADPINNGEISMNASVLKMKSNGQVQQLGGDPNSIVTFDGVQVTLKELMAGLG